MSADTIVPENVDWPKAFKRLIAKYKDKKHPLDYKNIYQLLVMVVLSAQDSDANINRQAPEFFKRFPDMQALANANSEELKQQLSKVRFHNKKIIRLQELAAAVKEDKNIPLTMAELDVLPGIGRKSANVIMREAGVQTEGIMCDLHVVRVAPRLGIAKGNNADKIEKELMAALPRKMWTEAGMAMSHLGREVCRPTNPKHDECVMNKVCSYCLSKHGLDVPSPE
jgi:endonuclease-3